MNSADYADALTTLADAQAWAREVLAGVLAARADAGIIADALISPAPGSPVEFDSRSAAVATLEGVARALLDGNLSTAWWPDLAGDWHELQQPGTDDFSWQLSMSLVKYRQDCNDNAQAKTALIDAAVSIDEVLEVDLSTGWPSRSVAGGFSIPGGGGGCQIDEYSTPGSYTWTKPAGAVRVDFAIVGGGGGGASGGTGALGAFVRGGPGGGGGGYRYASINASDLDASVDVYVGAGGTGGTSIAASSTLGDDGSGGEDSYIYDSTFYVSGYGGRAGLGSYLLGGNGGAAEDNTSDNKFYILHTYASTGLEFPLCFGGHGGPGVEEMCGTTSTGSGGGAGGGVSDDGQTYGPTNVLCNAGWAGGSSVDGGPGGGGGGSLTTASVAQRGGKGGASGYGAPRTFSNVASGSGSAGATSGTGFGPIGISEFGGGGGDASTSGTGGSGGSAARGGGGGGGGAAVNGSSSGAGGNGGDGFVRITTWF